MLFLKSTSVSVAPGKTFGVFVAVAADNPPQDLLAAIEDRSPGLQENRRQALHA
jgi:hypothetical protein